ncbi:MAG: SWIM zinc finger family protein [Firmicutes bacterium]|jgi:uncharacterized Zn finger protein|nr:SWIM zinc finger family protein [Bacillota bacterium]
MGVLNMASGQSMCRGYEYFKEKRVVRMDERDKGILTGAVSGSDGKIYDVTVNVAHPRKSRCNCLHAKGRQIVCKHMVAVYFTAFPQEAEEYITEPENYWEEEEQRKQENEERLLKYVSKMKKSELQDALLDLLFEGPEWQYDRFIRENIDC